ncbi:MAG: hypothetical protein WA081_12105 [Desulfosalsimonadaceae bacterium]
MAFLLAGGFFTPAFFRGVVFLADRVADDAKTRFLAGAFFEGGAFFIIQTILVVK